MQISTTETTRERQKSKKEKEKKDIPPPHYRSPIPASNAPSPPSAFSADPACASRSAPLYRDSLRSPARDISFLIFPVETTLLLSLLRTTVQTPLHEHERNGSRLDVDSPRSLSFEADLPNTLNTLEGALLIVGRVTAAAAANRDVLRSRRDILHSS